MESAAKKIRQEYQDEEDRISSLPNELVHKILSFTDAKEAVRTSVLSKRWKPIWLTLPFLNFGIYTNCSFHKTYMFLRHVLLNRDHHSNVYQLNLSVSDKFCVKVPNERSLLKRFIEYAISHSVENLGIRLAYNNYKPFKLSTFSSKSLRKLTLQLVLDDESVESDCWDLPVLTTLHLKADPNDCPDLPYSCLTCLPALTTLCLEDWDFTSYFSFTFSKLTTLCLSGPDRLPETVWNFPCLLSLELAVDLPRNINHVLSTFVNLQNLTIVLREMFWKPDLFISCPQLLNLNLTICSSVPPTYSIAVLAPKLCSFTSSGIFSITFGVIQLQNVNIKLQDWFQDMKREDREKYYLRFTNMLLGFGSAKNISFDSDSIEVLSAISDFLCKCSFSIL
ncbi:FBD-associated F-box protein At4g10400-like [Apium graveolens]|uniref:FBD-associated F-box protein At4g10400-like n=1 Tax=Apium graveolens TaxID=4045 RepID=UPI003D7A0822